MARVAKIEVMEGNPLAALQAFLARLLGSGLINALLVPQHLPMKNVVMPTLVTDPAKVSGADPLAPVFPINAARMVSKLTRKPVGGTVAAVLRPCEMRAFIELVKLKQGSLDEVLLIGADCLGAYRNVDYPRFASEAGDSVQSTLHFQRSVLEGKAAASNGLDLSPACKACDHFLPDVADIQIGLLGMDIDRQLLVQASSAKGESLLDQIGLPAATEPGERQAAVSQLLDQRVSYRDQMIAETREATSSLEKLNAYLANCVNCYNCRVACPVCYCKECVFLTNVFEHDPDQYLRWAKRKGLIKMPTDTVFYHITRMVHMSTACVGCGQCSNACPNNVPVMELFRTIASDTQLVFNYEPGRSVTDEPPLSVFREGEFAEVTGGKD
jgi:formate dehydrogenase (coenzyme F420) beta subunit